MKEVASHTPGPWKWTTNERIVTADGDLLLTGISMPLGNHPQREEAAANARFIVRACNSHAELCKVLDRVLDSPSEPDKWHQDIRFALRNADGKERKPSLAIERLAQIKASEVSQLKASNRELLAALEALVARTKQTDNPSDMGVSSRDEVMAQAEAAIQKAKP